MVGKARNIDLVLICAYDINNILVVNFLYSKIREHLVTGGTIVIADQKHRLGFFVRLKPGYSIKFFKDFVINLLLPGAGCQQYEQQENTAIL